MDKRCGHGMAASACAYCADGFTPTGPDKFRPKAAAADANSLFRAPVAFHGDEPVRRLVRRVPVTRQPSPADIALGRTEPVIRKRTMRGKARVTARERELLGTPLTDAQLAARAADEERRALAMDRESTRTGRMEARERRYDPPTKHDAEHERRTFESGERVKPVAKPVAPVRLAPGDE